MSFSGSRNTNNNSFNFIPTSPTSSSFNLFIPSTSASSREAHDMYAELGYALRPSNRNRQASTGRAPTSKPKANAAATNATRKAADRSSWSSVSSASSTASSASWASLASTTSSSTLVSTTSTKSRSSFRKWLSSL